MLRTVSVNGFEYDLRFVPGWFKLFSRVTCHRVSTLIYFLSFCFRSEYSAFWRCVKAGAAYLVTQLCKVKVSSNWFLVIVTRWSQLFFKHLKDLSHFTVYTVLRSVLQCTALVQTILLSWYEIFRVLGSLFFIYIYLFSSTYSYSITQDEHICSIYMHGFHSLTLSYSNSWLRFEVKLLKTEHEGILDIFCMTFKWAWQSCNVEIQ